MLWLRLKLQSSYKYWGIGLHTITLESLYTEVWYIGPRSKILILFSLKINEFNLDLSIF